MSGWQLIQHLAAFAAAPLSVGLLLALAHRFIWPRRPLPGGWPGAAALVGLSGLIAQAVAFAVQGRDGTVVGWAALLLTSAGSLWLLGRHWRD